MRGTRLLTVFDCIGYLHSRNPAQLCLPALRSTSQARPSACACRLQQGSDSACLGLGHDRKGMPCILGKHGLLSVVRIRGSCSQGGLRFRPCSRTENGRDSVGTSRRPGKNPSYQECIGRSRRTLRHEGSPSAGVPVQGPGSAARTSHNTGHSMLRAHAWDVLACRQISLGGINHLPLRTGWLPANHTGSSSNANEEGGQRTSVEIRDLMEPIVLPTRHLPRGLNVHLWNSHASLRRQDCG